MISLLGQYRWYIVAALVALFGASCLMCRSSGYRTGYKDGALDAAKACRDAGGSIDIDNDRRRGGFLRRLLFPAPRLQDALETGGGARIIEPAPTEALPELFEAPSGHLEPIPDPMPNAPEEKEAADLPPTLSNYDCASAAADLEEHFANCRQCRFERKCTEGDRLYRRARSLCGEVP